MKSTFSTNTARQKSAQYVRSDPSILYGCFLSAEIANHTHALTVTLNNDTSSEPYQNRRMRLEATVRHLLFRISRKCFKNQHKKSGFQIPALTVVEGVHNAHRLHAHLSLVCPSGMAEAQFLTTVRAAVNRCKSLGPQCVIKRITDNEGWASYMAKEGIEAFSPRCTQRAKH
jgi:hypothetical protein